MNVLEILKSHLKSIGADGLCNIEHWNEECGCGFDDFAPCGQWIGSCLPARKISVPTDDKYDNGVRYVLLTEAKGDQS